MKRSMIIIGLMGIIIFGIAMDIIKPTSITNPDGEEINKQTVPEGNILGDGTNDRILFGFQKNGFGDKNFGLKVSQEGYDVKTATDAQLIMSSEFNMFKIVESGTATVTPTNTGAPNYTVASGGYSTTVTLTNPTGNRPAVVAFFTFPFALTSGTIQIYTTNPQALPYTAVLSAGNVSATFFYEITTTTVKFWYNQYTASVDFGVTPNITFTYYIMQETSN